MKSAIIQRFLESKRQFDMERNKEDGSKAMEKIIKIINQLGSHWNSFNGGELAEYQMKLAGYSFYLSDYLSELSRISEQLKLEIKEIRARRWDEISEVIKAEKGKVQNKDQIENILVIETKELANEQILYETLFFKYKLKLAALRDILTCLVQRIAEKKNELERSKSLQ